MIVSRLILVRMRGILEESCRENHNTPSPPENSDVFETIWKNMVKPDWPLMTIYGSCAFHAR